MNECKAKRHTCHKNAFCINHPGSYKCHCRKGFSQLKGKGPCVKNSRLQDENGEIMMRHGATRSFYQMYLSSLPLHAPLSQAVVNLSLPSLKYVIVISLEWLLVYLFSWCDSPTKDIVAYPGYHLCYLFDFGLNLNLGVCAVYISDLLMEVTFYIQ